MLPRKDPRSKGKRDGRRLRREQRRLPRKRGGFARTRKHMCSVKCATPGRDRGSAAAPAVTAAAAAVVLDSLSLTRQSVTPFSDNRRQR